MMKYLAIAFFVLVAAAVSSSIRADEKPLEVVICAGQSYMVGKRSKASDLPEVLRSEQTSLFFNGKTWISIAPGKTEKKGFGPEISFANEFIALLKEPVGIIKHSVGGTSLAEDWSPANPQSLYAELSAKVKAAKKDRNIQIIGMIWMQGERDSKNDSMADAYAINLAKLITTARKDFGSPQMPFIAGRVNPPKKRYPFLDKVRKAQEECKDVSYAFIDCDSQEKGSDNLHYTTKGIVELGQKFAEAIIELIPKK